MLSLRKLLRTYRLPRLYFSTQAPPANSANKRKKISILDLKKKYNSNIPITMVTAYDYTTAKMVDESGIDMILVGDSLGMVMLGYDSTVPVTMDEMIHHSKAVARGAKASFLVGDMPFGSYEPHEPSLAIKNALRFLKEAGMDAVKIECGKEMKNTIRTIVESGIPVMGHVGLTPQRISALGGFRVQGKTVESAQKVLEDALELQEAGCFSLVIESVPEPLAQYITKKLRIPTIGIGAGKYTSGQVLVYHDMLGMYPNFTPKFVKKYQNLHSSITNALKEYKREVEAGVFPEKQHTYEVDEKVLENAFPDFRPIISNVKDCQQSNSTETKPKELNVSYQPKRFKIAVIGGGSMGSLISGRLAHSQKHDVFLISSWKDHVDKINTEGLQIENLDRSITRVQNIRATTDPKEIVEKYGPVDLAIILVKSPFTRIAAERAKVVLHKDGVALTLQNGIGNAEVLSSILGKDRILMGVTCHGSEVKREGFVCHRGTGATTLCSSTLGGNNSIPKDIGVALSDAGFDIQFQDNVDSLLWGKLVVNAGINPLTAILKVKNGELLTPENSILVKKAVEEAVAVASKLGIQLPFSDALEAVLKVAKDTRMNQSSMLYDTLRGVPTEIDAINGIIVEHAKKLGVPVPFNTQLVHLVKKISM